MAANVVNENSTCWLTVAPSTARAPPKHPLRLPGTSMTALTAPP